MNVETILEKIDETAIAMGWSRYNTFREILKCMSPIGLEQFSQAFGRLAEKIDAGEIKRGEHVTD